MTSRLVRVGLTTYRTVDGGYRLAHEGDTVDVHPDYLERFDRLNVLAGQGPEPAAESEPETEPEPESAPKPRTRTRKED